MARNRFVQALFGLLLLSMFSTSLFAAGGTSIVASKGRPAHVIADWPEGVDKIVNDEARTFGWNSWFTEWPNDVNQYALEIKSTAELNRLVNNLASVKSDLLQIRLSHLREPGGLGWVTRAPKDNNVPVMFSIGSQARIDQWYQRVRKPFGVMEFTAAPVAVPPTLTLFVQNEAIDLSEVKIPPNIQVSMGYVPTVFHKSNTTIEKQKEEEAAKTDSDQAMQKIKQGLDEASVTAFEQIQDFLRKREAESAAE